MGLGSWRPPISDCPSESRIGERRTSGWVLAGAHLSGLNLQSVDRAGPAGGQVPRPLSLWSVPRGAPCTLCRGAPSCLEHCLLTHLGCVGGTATLSPRSQQLLEGHWLLFPASVSPDPLRGQSGGRGRNLGGGLLLPPTGGHRHRERALPECVQQWGWGLCRVLWPALAAPAHSPTPLCFPLPGQTLR